MPLTRTSQWLIRGPPSIGDVAFNDCIHRKKTRIPLAFTTSSSMFTRFRIRVCSSPTRSGLGKGHSLIRPLSLFLASSWLALSISFHEHTKHYSFTQRSKASVVYFYFMFRDSDKQNGRNLSHTSLATRLSAHSNPCRGTYSPVFILYTIVDRIPKGNVYNIVGAL
ncbi:hypothetical protein BC826DRAFT_1025075 [Russula brevipes]|nr:hypothetical protein BC826DRAFT_1025075 [Russula brevipes]